LDSSATILFSNNGNKSDVFSRLLLGALSLCILTLIVYSAFQESIFEWLISLMPMDQGKTPFYYEDLFRLAVYEIYWVCALLLVALVLRTKPGWLASIEKMSIYMSESPTKFRNIVIVAFGVVVLTTSLLVLDGFPNSSDEYVYLYQGHTLERGRLWERSHPVDKSFGFNHIARQNGITVGRFPPGWPLVLSLFMLMGIPAALVNPILSILTLLVFYSFARRIYNPVVAGWSLLFLSATAFFLFNSASYFSHSVCLLAIVLFISLCERFEVQRKIYYLLFAGCMIGLIAITRYYTAALLVLPFVVVSFYRKGWKVIPEFIWIGIGALPFIGFFLWYNYNITGNVFQPVTVWAYKGEGLGFVHGHTLPKGLEHIVRRFLMFGYWCSPVLLLLYFIFIFQKMRKKEIAMTNAEDYFFLVLVVGYLLYYEIGGNQYGPRFYFEALPFLIVLIVNGVFREKKHWAKVLLVAGLIIAVVKIPVIAARENRIIDERLDVYKLVEEQKLSNAVVLLSTGTSVTRPMPSGDLTRNDFSYSNSVLYAIDHIHANEKLMEYYRDRSFYRYVRAKNQPRGRLEKIR
jgi:hypothetical protein